MSKAASRPGPDSTLDEVREQLIESGIQLLRERGVDVGFARVSLSDTIEASGTSRSTAYRSLADDDLAPQAVLHRDLMVTILNRTTREERMGVITDAVTAQLELETEALASGDCAARTASMRAIIRAGANASFDTVVTSHERAILISLFGALQSIDTSDWRHEAITQGERNLTEGFAAMYQQLLDFFQYRVKAPFTMEQLAVLAAAQIEGLAMRAGLNPFVEPVQRTSHSGDTEHDWSLFAVGFEALVLSMCEPINAADPFADLSRH